MHAEKNKQTIDATDMLQILNQAQQQFATEDDPKQKFEQLLSGLLQLTASEYGFIGEVLYSLDNQPYLKTYAISELAWNQSTRKIYEKTLNEGLEFFNLNTLFGHVLKTGEPLIANEPDKDPRSGGTPEGHPPMNAFLGLPIHLGEQLIGMAGIANRPGGYEESLIEELKPYLITCSTLITVFRKKREVERNAQQLRESENRHRTIVEAMIDGIVIIDAEGTICHFNHAAEKIFGYQADDVIGRKINFLMPDSCTLPLNDFIEKYAKIGRPNIAERNRLIYGRRKTGRCFPMDLAIGEMQVDGQPMYTAIVRDISEQEMSAKMIQASTSRLLAVLDHVVDGIITINRQGIIESFNRAAENIFGYTCDEVVDKNISMLMPPEFAAEHESYLKNYLAGGEAKIIGVGREVTGRRKDGSTFPLDLAVSEMQIGDDVMFNGIVRDITERKRIETMKNEFISTVSHELRTPLTSIHGSVALILGGAMGQVPPAMEELMKITASNTERLLLLINDILDIQKIESGKMDFRFEPLDISALLEQAVAENRAYASQFGVGFKLSCAKKDLRVMADRSRIMQVMANLLSNASKFSPQGTQVEIVTSIQRNSIRICVSDRGPGVPDEFKKLLFEKFTQADSTDARSKGGTGLGLNISRLIVEKHGGVIDFVSHPSIGTCVFFDLPCLIAGKPGERVTAIRSQEFNIPRILIVADETDAGEWMRRTIVEAGFNCDIAQGAREALNLLQNRRKYRAMVVDINLPDDESCDLLGNLTIPAVIMSLQDEGRRGCGGNTEFFDWLSKPVDQSRLEQQVKKTMERIPPA